MGLQLRVSMPDQPGALSRVTRAIARAGADVLSVSVLESDLGRATDEFRLRWPDGKDHSPLLAAIADEPGVQVIGCRRSRWLLDGRADLDLLTYLLAVPDRGVETLVDMAPAAVDADWAELRAPSRRLPLMYGSATTVYDEVAPDSMPIRAMTGMSGEISWVHLPLPPLHSVLVIGRDGGPGFLRAEITHADRVITLALKTLTTVLQSAPPSSRATDLTAALSKGRAEELTPTG
jgi:hypothetical protein